MPTSMHPPAKLGNEHFLPNSDPTRSLCFTPRVKITLTQATNLHEALRAYRAQLWRNPSNPAAARAARILTRIIRQLPDTRYKPYVFELRDGHLEWPFVSRALRPLGAATPEPGSREARWLATYHALNRRGFARIDTEPGAARRAAKTLARARKGLSTK